MAMVPAEAMQPAAQDANIIRDASLDQYLEAHQQFAQQPVMDGIELCRALKTGRTPARPDTQIEKSSPCQTPASGGRMTRPVCGV